MRRRTIAQVAVVPDGLVLTTGAGVSHVRLAEVSRVTAYKRDELTTDLVCFDVVADGADGPRTRTIHEDLPGFGEAVLLLETLPGFDRDWRASVMHPPFAACVTTVFHRDVALRSG